MFKALSHIGTMVVSVYLYIFPPQDSQDKEHGDQKVGKTVIGAHDDMYCISSNRMASPEPGTAFVPLTALLLRLSLAAE